MRGLSGTISVARALRANSTAASTFLRPPRAASYAVTYWTTSNPQNLVDRSNLSTPSVIRSDVIGFRHYGSAAAASPAEQDLKPRISEQNSFNPKEVVLFQYEACPFCNKVKGKNLFKLNVTCLFFNLDEYCFEFPIVFCILFSSVSRLSWYSVQSGRSKSYEQERD